ncbi:DUF6460 domain-containing protein [Methylocella sp.]|uniref:DUF6460 domain-containing protein n=1 Tax=Methylocella sp. TaxID=1978226 RepID=UPI003782F875
MSDRFSEPAPPTPPGWTTSRPEPGAASGPAPAAAAPATIDPARAPQDALTRFLGGSPASVALRLFFISLIVGAIFMWLGLRPSDLLRGLADFANAFSRLGFDAFRELMNYALAGAAVVLPIWLILRLLDMRGGK